MSADLAAAPFEGPEKLLELWFAPSPSALDGQGLRSIDRKLWEEVLDIVKCQILSVVHGSDTDAYLLRHVPILSVPLSISSPSANHPSLSHPIA
jgi:S-adenosylmethionine decarboxylase